mgnify:FL=1|jgi:hypothetical protein
MFSTHQLRLLLNYDHLLLQEEEEEEEKEEKKEEDYTLWL